MDKQVYRHEYKYRISNASAELLKRRLKAVLRSDKNAGPNGGYLIRSLYFDDMEYTAFNEKIAGVCDRAKYRLRCYNYDDSYIVFEKKERHGIYCRKQSAVVDLDTADAIIACNRAAMYRTKKPLLVEFATRCATSHFKPRVLLDYDRTAFTYPISDVRITLDLNLRSVPFKTDFFDDLCGMYPIYPDGEQLLEVKFNEFLPEFIGDLLADIPKTLIANSKYTLCLMQTME